MAKIGNLHTDMKFKRLMHILFFQAILCTAVLGQSIDFNASVSTNRIGLNEQFELNFELSAAKANNLPQPPVPELDDFATYVGSSSSQNISIVNGNMSVTKTYTHHYIATKEGSFTIPPVSFQHNNKTYSSQPIDIQIVKNAANAPGRSGSTRRAPDEKTQDLSDLLFVQATVNKESVYQNEPVIVSYKIYTAVNVTNYGIPQLPNMVGFWSEEFDQPKRLSLSSKVVNGRQYRVAEIKKFALFPQGSGKKSLAPITVECEVQLPRRRNRDLFDNFFNDSFFNRTVRRTVTSNSVDIDVKPLPSANKPADFSGLVGNFTITAGVDNNKVKSNEAVTLDIEISGSGNVRIISPPEIDFPADFEVYDPKVQENISRRNDRISGSKSFEYVFIPRFAGEYTIKPVKLSYFDLNSKTYKTISTKPISISVSKSDDQFVSVGVANSKEDVKFIGKDIRYIQMRLPEFREIGPAFYKEFTFYLFLVLPLLGLIGTYGYKAHLDRLSSNVAYARSRKANQMALRRLKMADREMNKGNSREFYSEVAKALMGFIGDKFNISAAGLITDEVETMLRKRQINENIVQNYLGCLQTCDFNRFAPSDSDDAQMNDFFEKAKQAIIDLDKSF